VLGAITCVALSKWFAPPPATDPIDVTATEEADAGYPLAVSVAVIGAFLGVVVIGLPVVGAFHPAIVKEFTTWLIPSLVIGFLAFGYLRGVPVYEVFVQGARDGFDVAVKIIPYLVGILVAVGMFTSSGALHAFAGLVGPFTSKLGLPAEALPMAMIRPLSGSGATGVLMATLSEKATGPDTYVGYLVSTISGSSETTFYVLSVYYGAIGIKNVRHTLPAALLADLFGLIGSIIAVQAYYRLVLGLTP
jgi:spore maturation protein SpmB